MFSHLSCALLEAQTLHAHQALIFANVLQGRYIVALKETVDHRFVTNLLQKRFPEYEIYTGKEGPCVDLIDISRVSPRQSFTPAMPSTESR